MWQPNRGFENQVGHGALRVYNRMRTYVHSVCVPATCGQAQVLTQPQRVCSVYDPLEWTFSRMTVYKHEDYMLLVYYLRIHRQEQTLGRGLEGLPSHLSAPASKRIVLSAFCEQGASRPLEQKYGRAIFAEKQELIKVSVLRR